MLNVVVFSPPLSGVVLDGANLRRMDLSDARLVDASLVRAELSGCNIGDARFTGADLTGARLDGSNLEDADFSRAKLPGASLRGSNLEHVSLVDADLSSAVLDGSNLEEVDLRGGIRFVDSPRTEDYVDATALAERIAAVARELDWELPSATAFDPTRT